MDLCLGQNAGFMILVSGWVGFASFGSYGILRSCDCDGAFCGKVRCSYVSCCLSSCVWSFEALESDRA